MAINLDPEEVKEVFGGSDPRAHEPEARRRWGSTEAYRESDRRTSNYTAEDWKRHNSESEEIEAGFASIMLAGIPADGTEAKALADRHRELIDRWFYPCSYDMHTGLAEMYVADGRFTQHYDRRAPGLAQYVHDAIMANALDHM